MWSIEMKRALLEHHRASWDLTRFHPSERVRSLQLYGTDPGHLSEAVRHRFQVNGLVANDSSVRFFVSPGLRVTGIETGLVFERSRWKNFSCTCATAEDEAAPRRGEFPAPRAVFSTSKKDSKHKGLRRRPAPAEEASRSLMLRVQCG